MPKVIKETGNWFRFYRGDYIGSWLEQDSYSYEMAGDTVFTKHTFWRLI